MSYSVVFPKPWNYRHPKRGRSIMEPGRYRVPEDVSDEIAQRAVAEGMARREAAFGAIFDRRQTGALDLSTLVRKAPSKPKTPRKGRKKNTAAVQPA